MSDIKVYWTADFWTTDRKTLLNFLAKMTPGRSLRWKNMISVDTMDEADFVLSWDGNNKNLPLEKTIIFSDIPPALDDWTPFNEYKNKALLVLPADKWLNAGYWYMQWDYDTVASMTPPTKTKKAVVAFTAKYHLKQYTDRIEFVKKLMRLKADVDLYGRPERYFAMQRDLMKYYRGPLGTPQPDFIKFEHHAGKEILKDYRYSIEFDNGPCPYYFSERVYDSLFAWCMPLYWGGTDMQLYLPQESFRYIDIEDPTEDSAEKAIDIINSDYREQHIEQIAEARHLLLNKYQMWPALYEVVTNIDKYRERYNG